MTFIPNAKTYETVDAEYSYYAGVAFGNFSDACGYSGYAGRDDP